MTNLIIIEGKMTIRRVLVRKSHFFWRIESKPCSWFSLEFFVKSSFLGFGVLWLTSLSILCCKPYPLLTLLSPSSAFECRKFWPTIEFLEWKCMICLNHPQGSFIVWPLKSKFCKEFKACSIGRMRIDLLSVANNIEGCVNVLIDIMKALQFHRQKKKQKFPILSSIVKNQEPNFNFVEVDVP